MARVRSKFFKYLTIAGATLGVVSSGAFAAVMAINATNDNFIIDELREYTARFYNEDTLIEETTYKRGEELVAPANPEHELDGEYNYFFIGWDTSGNGLPDVMPTRMYYSFTAKAVYMKTGKFDLSFMDLANMDLESLMDLLDKLNIDWEQFMDMFDIDPETLMQWLMQNAVLSFEADASRYIAYFRSTSFGDFNYDKKQFNAPGFYDSNNISPGSINPLTYTADKLHNAAKMTGMLPETFDFVDYDITFNSQQDYYPVPDCELSDDMGEIVDSDAHYIKNPTNNTYHTTAAYVPATTTTIDLLGNFLIKYTNNNVVASDEINYYNYALANYTAIPREYEAIIDQMISDNEWVDGEYTQIERIGAYVENLGKCSMFEDGQVNFSYEKNTDPVMGLIENESGSDLDFNTTAVMIFRRLHIPARIVKGYVVPNIQQGTNVITLLHQHYWCEIYVKRIGWMVCDCMNAEDFLGTNPYGELDKQTNPLEEEEEQPKQLEEIEITPPTKLEYDIGDSLDLSGASITAFYNDETSEEVSIYSRDVEISGFDSSTPGEKEVTVTYTDSNGIVKTDIFIVTVLQKEPEVDYVEFKTENMTQPHAQYINPITEEKKLSYYEIDIDEEENKLSKEGLEVWVHFKDNPDPVEPENITKKAEINGEYDLATEGVYENVYITVVYKDQVYSEHIIIEVIKNRPIDMLITKLPDDVEYYTGEKFDPSGIEYQMLFESDKTSRATKEFNRYNLEYRNAETREVLYRVDYLGQNYDGSPITNITRFTFEDPKDNLVVELRYYFTDKHGNTVYVSDTFEIKVELNEILDAHDYDFKQTYTLGTKFDEDEFVQNGYLIVDLENDKTAQLSNGKTKVSQDIDYEYSTQFEVINDPDLGHLGDTNVTVRYMYKDEEHTIDIPVTVQQVSVMDYVTDNLVPYAGPGDGVISDLPLFNFTTDYVGTMYFTNRNYSSYSATDGWSMNTSNYSVSPNSFAYDKISKVYNTYQVQVDYLSELQYGVYPNYSNTSGTDAYHISPTLNNTINATSESFSISNFVLNEENAANRLINYTNYSNSVKSAYNSYNTSRYTSYTSDAADEIRSYIQSMGYQDVYGNFLGSYSNSNLSGKIDLVLAVKNDLKNNFNYNNNFSYDSFRGDPAELFFTKTDGSGKFTGNSKNLATAATLIYRQLGIPARYVTGFGAQSTGGQVTVTAKNAHAWTEVWFENLGWIIVDPSGYDTGAKLDSSGEYGHGFGGAGITNGYSLAYYGGNYIITYNYGSKFKHNDDPDVDVDWYATYDNTDKHNIYNIELEPGAYLPDYLEYKLYFEWTRNDVYLGEYSANGCPGYTVGVYTLTPVLRIFDRSLYDQYNPDPYHNEVTALYGYDFQPGTEPMEYYIAPLVIYVEINPKKDTYSLSTDGTGIQVTISSSQVNLAINNLDPSDEMWEYIDTLPSGISVKISGSVTYTETGTVVLDPDAFEVYLTDTYGNHLDEYSYAIITIYGVVTIEP